MPTDDEVRAMLTWLDHEDELIKDRRDDGAETKYSNAIPAAVCRSQDDVKAVLLSWAIVTREARAA